MAGCGYEVGAVQPVDQPVTIVLTFDDGPLSADVQATDFDLNRQAILGPVDTILGTLAKRNIRAVFYIKGPGSPENGEKLKEAYLEEIPKMSRAGHILGYHAYNHAQRLWGIPAQPHGQWALDMKNDLQNLKDYINEIFVPLNILGQDFFSPIFRQPFGGDRLREMEGWVAAMKSGLVCHGYAIDSFDWTGNLDALPSLIAHMQVATEDDHVEFVLAQFSRKANELADRQVVDVLLHVNHFTANHLDQWIDALKTDFEQSTGKTVVFDVPACYLNESDFEMDASIFHFLF